MEPATSGCLLVVIAISSWAFRPLHWGLYIWAAVFLWPAIKIAIWPVYTFSVATLNGAILLPVALGACVARFPKGRSRGLVGLVLAFTVTALIQAVRALASEWHGGWPPMLGRWAGGVFLSSNHLAAALEFCAVAVLLLGTRWPRGRWVSLLAFVGFATVLLLTRSRGGWLVLLATLGIIAGAGRIAYPARVIMMLALAGCIAAAVVYSPLRVRFERWTTPDLPATAIAPLGLNQA